MRKTTTTTTINREPARTDRLLDQSSHSLGPGSAEQWGKGEKKRIGERKKVNLNEHLEQRPLNPSLQLLAPCKRLIERLKQN